MRVPVGTELVVSVRNDIPDTTLVVHGLYTRPAEADTALSVPAGQTRTVRFMAGDAGTYFYWATTGTGHSRSATASTAPGPPLVLMRNQPVAITIVNHLREATAIHWHGMELESYFDGVPGFSGTAGSVSPVIPPGGSFEARFTPPRSGTFTYHTHASDAQQLAAGLYGGLVVADDRAALDPQNESVVLLGLYGSVTPDTLAINGHRTPEFTLRASAPHRFRLINITANNGGFNVTLTSPANAVQWTPVAKDGADLSASQRQPRPANRQPLSVGETIDFEWRPPAPGVYWIEVRRGSGEWMGQTRVVVTP